jgi:hypothetical protein
MLVAAAGAAALDKWAEGALLLFLFSIGHALEHYAMGRARRAIAALGELAPPTADVRRDGLVSEVAVADLVIGDTIVIKPNTRIPADGFVSLGARAALIKPRSPAKACRWTSRPSTMLAAPPGNPTVWQPSIASMPALSMAAAYWKSG